jgi:tripartite ATP-independent transporter DctM subunit
MAPAYEVPSASLFERLIPVVRDVIPLGLIIFLVTGVIFLGIATPSEAAATGSFGALVLALLYRKVNRKMMKQVLISTLEISIMIYMIIASAVAFSTTLALTGASRGLVEFVTGLGFAPILIVIAMLFIILILGMFMECVAMMMITIPLFMPIIISLGIDQVWFAVVMLLAVSSGAVTPPFGLDMFVLKGVVPPRISLGDIYRASMPFLILTLIVMAILIAFPALSTWLPSLMLR